MPKFYTIAPTGTVEDWGQGPNHGAAPDAETDPKKHIRFGIIEKGILLTDDADDGTKLSNSTCTVTLITDTDKINALKTKYKYS
tara:strand:- start:8363 stop:8614 length:252 start_codon:yes stop_codon:yes gene_type:complete